MRTHDCEPTLNDSQVLDFCRKGVLMLDGGVPDEINQRVIEYLDTPSGTRPDAAKLFDEDWFVENVFLNPESTEGGRRVSVLRRQEGAAVLLG